MFLAILFSCERLTDRLFFFFFFSYRQELICFGKAIPGVDSTDGITEYKS